MPSRPSLRAKQEFAQSCLAFGKRSALHVITIEHQQVESAGDREVIVDAAVQGIKISHPVLAGANHLGIENSRALKPVGFVNDERIAPCPVSAIHHVEAHPSVADVNLQPIAVVFEFNAPSRHHAAALCD